MPGRFLAMTLTIVLLGLARAGNASLMSAVGWENNVVQIVTSGLNDSMWTPCFYPDPVVTTHEPCANQDIARVLANVSSAASNDDPAIAYYDVHTASLLGNHSWSAPPHGANEIVLCLTGSVSPNLFVTYCSFVNEEDVSLPPPAANEACAQTHGNGERVLRAGCSFTAPKAIETVHGLIDAALTLIM